MLTDTTPYLRKSPNDDQDQHFEFQLRLTDPAFVFHPRDTGRQQPRALSCEVRRLGARSGEVDTGVVGSGRVFSAREFSV